MGALLQLLAVFALVNFAQTVFSGRGRDPRALGLAALGIVFMTVLTDWPVHAAAGMLLGVLFSRAFGVGRSPWPMVWALACAMIFAVSGAGWVIAPAAVAAGLWLFMGNGLTALSELGRSQPTLGPLPLPGQAEGLPIPERAPQPEGVPAERSDPAQKRTDPVAAARPLPDALSSLLTQPRLPERARAQLEELDQVTAEALASLERQGERGGGPLYDLRALRQEYAPQVVQAYLNLPPTLADTAVLEDGKTGRDLLHEQLELLLGVAHDLLRYSAQAGSRELRTNGRFLREKFGPQARDLKA